MLTQDYQPDQERIEAAERVAEDWYLDGATDAAFRELPQYANPAYLSGYLATIKQLPCLPDGRIQYALQPSPENTSEIDEF